MMLNIILIFIVLDLHQNCYSLTQNDKKLYLHLSNQDISGHRQSNLKYQRQENPKSNMKTIGTDLVSIEAIEIQQDSPFKRDIENYFRQVRAGYKTISTDEEYKDRNTGKNQKSVDTYEKNEKNSFELDNAVRFFRRNNHWKPKRVITFKPNNIKEKTLYKTEYKLNKNYNDNQNVDQVYSDCCIVTSNTITIHSASKPIYNYKAPGYLPPIDTPPTQVVLPPKTNDRNKPNVHPVERGDIPEEPSEISPEMAMPVPEDSPTVEAIETTSTLKATTTKRTTIPVQINKLTTPIFESNRNSKDETSTISSFKGIKYLPPEDSSTVTEMTPLSGAAPSMPVPTLHDETNSSTSPTDDQKSHPSSITVPEYLLPKTTTPALVTSSSDAEPAMAMPVPPQLDESPSTSLPVTSFGSVETTATTPTLDKSPSDAEPAMAMPVPPELDESPSTSLPVTSFGSVETSATTPTLDKSPSDAEPAMAIPVPPELEESLPVTSFGSVETSATTPTLDKSPSDGEPAMAMPVPPELEESPSTSSPVTGYRSVETSATTPTLGKNSSDDETTNSIPVTPGSEKFPSPTAESSKPSTPMVSDTPFKGPEYLPPDLMLPAVPPAPAMVVPVTPDFDQNADDSPNIDPRSFSDE